MCNIVLCDISLYTLSHTACYFHLPFIPQNAEGYVQTTPAMSAPGGRALAGYPDPHAHCIPINFESIKNTIGMASVNRLIEELFVNDVPHLRIGGKLYEVTLTCAACLVGSYNKLYTDLKSAFEETPSYGVGPDNNVIMIAIREAAKIAKIEDPTIAEIPNVPRYIVVLRGWSRLVSAAHRRNNPQPR